METILHIHYNIYIKYIRGLIFEVCQKSAKTAKYNSLENFRLYGIQYKLTHFLIIFLPLPATLAYRVAGSFGLKSKSRQAAGICLVAS